MARCKLGRAHCAHSTAERRPWVHILSVRVCPSHAAHFPLCPLLSLQVLPMCIYRPVWNEEQRLRSVIIGCGLCAACHCARVGVMVHLTHVCLHVEAQPECKPDILVCFADGACISFILMLVTSPPSFLNVMRIVAHKFIDFYWLLQMRHVDVSDSCEVSLATQHEHLLFFCSGPFMTSVVLSGCGLHCGEGADDLSCEALQSSCSLLTSL